MGMFDFKLPKIRIPKWKAPSARKILPRKRDIARMVSARRIREPIPAKVKHVIESRAGNMCEGSQCQQRQYLEFHHLNMKNDDNRISNIRLLCPNHHKAWHDKNKKVSHRNITGRETESVIVKKGKYKETKAKMREKYSLIPKFELPKLGF